MGKPKKGSSLLLLLLGLLLLVADNSAASASAVSPALEIVSEVVSNAAASLLRRLWSGKSTAKTAAQGSRPLMKFEGGYTVDTVFDGSKLGIEPYSVVVAQSGELLVLDSVNSNLYGISLPLSRYSRPKLVAGSAEGYAGHVDGKLREARMNHPRGFTMDDRGNIYVADTLNMAIRKISDTGVTTISGGKWKKGGHLDGPSEDAKFSNDFEVVYVASSCSLLIVDRGNQAIREIQLNFDDCAYQYEAGFPLGMMVLFAAGFFGYMLALLQRRVGILVSSSNESQAPIRPSMPPYYKPMKHYVRPPYVRPPLIPTGDETEKTEERFFSSIGKLISGAFSSMTDIFGATFPIFITKSRAQYQHQQYRMNALPTMQESFAIPDDEIPPPVETRVSTPRKTYAFMSKEPEKIHHIRHGRPHFSGWDAALPPQQPQMHQQQHLQQHRQYSSGPRTYYEQSCETTNEIVFGVVQEMDNKRRTVQIKAVNYGDPMYEHYGLRYRNSFMGYTSNY